MSEANADKHSQELAALRSSQHLMGWLLALLLLVLIGMGGYQIFEATDRASRLASISNNITAIERHLNSIEKRHEEKKPVEPKKDGD